MGPLEFVPKLLEVEGARGPVLDVGVGSGRNAIWLAKQGFTVKSYDVDAEAVAEVNEFAKEQGLPISAMVADITDRAIYEQEYGVLLFTLVLHFLPREKAQELLRGVVGTAPIGAVHMLAVITDQGDFATLPKAKENFYPSSEEVRSFYEQAGWDIMYFEVAEGVMRAKREDGMPMKNRIAFVIARKG